MSDEIDNLVLSTVSEMIATGVGNPKIVQRVWLERDAAVCALQEIANSDYSALGLKRLAQRVLEEINEI